MIPRNASILAALMLAAASSHKVRAADGHAADDELALAAAQLTGTAKPVLIGAPSAGTVQANLADPADCLNNGSWSAIINWTPHIPVSAANLPDGRILTFASNQRTSFPAGPEFTYAATWNPATGTFQEFNNTSHDMFCGGITLMTDGRVLVNGGRNEVASTSVFDWRTNSWTRIQNMNGGRWYNTTVSMPNGNVFTATGSGTGLSTTERWSNAGWSVLTGISWPAVMAGETGYFTHWHPFVSLAPDGRLLHFGPTDTMHWFNAAGTGSFVSSNAAVPGVHYPKEGCWVMYDEGKVLVAGGGADTTPNPGDNSIGTSTKLAYTVNMSTNPPVVSGTGSMSYARQFANAVVLPSGEVLVIGGNSPGQKFSDNGSIMPCEIWNPKTGTWRTVASISVPRNYHSVALLLPDGRVWSAGGGLGGGDHQDAQLYSPPCFFTNSGTLATRPVLNTAPAKVGPGTTFTVTGTSGLVKFSFIRMAALTHSVNTDQRYLSLPFTETSAGTYQVTAHSNLNVMNPGYWMLFGINATGAFSVAKVIQVDATSGIAVTQPGDQTSTAGVPASLQINATAPTGTTLTYSAIGLPTGLTINASSGLITGTPSTSGTFPSRVTATGGGQSISQDFTWTVLLANTGTGKILREWWLNIANSDLNSLTANAAYPNSPTGSDQLTSFETPTDWAENLGQRVRGYLYPPISGQYRFWIASDDEGRLILSSNNNPANGSIVARVPTWTNSREWTRFAEQASAVITLQAGQPYYIEALMKEGGGGDNLAVAWQTPGSAGPAVIAGQYLSPWQNNRTPVLTNSGNRTNVVGNAVSLNVQASDADNDALTFGATGLPTSLTINSTTGVISGTPSVAGAFNVTLSVTDGRSTPVTASFIWTINPQVQLNPVPANPPSGAGTALTYTGSSTGGLNVLYKWSWGDGTVDTAFNSSPSASHTFAAPGRYQITLTATDDTGRITTFTFYQAINAPLTTRRPTASSSIIFEDRATGTNDRVWTVNQDNNSVSVFDVVTRTRLAEINVGTAPRSLAQGPDGRVWVTNMESGTVSIISGSTLAVVQTIGLARGSRPFGIAFDPDGTDGWIACEGTGQLLRMNPTTGVQVGALLIGLDARHVSVSADSSRVFVTRFITPLLPGEQTATITTNSTVGGEVFSVLTSNLTIEKTILQHSDRADTITTGRGIPNYLGPAIVSPDGLTAWVPSKQDNIKRGRLRDGNELTHDQTIRSIASRIALTNGAPASADDVTSRVDFDNAGIASNGAFDPKGIYLFTALEGSREVGVVDVWNKKEISRFSSGRAPQGIAVSPDGRTIYVQNFMDRNITVHDVGGIIDGQVAVPALVATLNCITTERLSPNVLLGKKHFYDAADPRIAFQQYISCAACHNDGGQDGRVWDFTGFGEGLRNTITLRGHGGTAHGPVHWTGNFDEIQDFENQIHSLPKGTGLISGADPNPPLGAPNAGRSNDLDSLALYVSSLTSSDASPSRNSDGSLTASAESGKLVFANFSCAGCHGGSRFTDSAVNLLHDIGTTKPSSGQRLGAALTGLDTPSLRGLWNTAPFLHDGSAATIEASIAAHRNVPVPAAGSASMTNLVNYLISIDELEADPSPTRFPITLSAPATATGAFTIDGGTTLAFAAGLLVSEFEVTNGTASNLVTLPQNAAFSVTITPTAPGVVTVRLPAGAMTFSTTATSLASNTTSTAYSLPNRAPVVTTPANQSTVRGATTSLQIAASDPDGNALTYSATGLPLGLSIGSSTGLISGTLSLTAANSNDVSVTVSDGTLSTLVNFVWTTTAPNRAPTVVKPVDQTSVRGTITSLQISANDADGNALRYTATGLPLGLTINENTGLISGTVSLSASATNNIEVMVSDAALSASTSFVWNTTAPPLTAVLASDASVITTQNFVVTLTLSEAVANVANSELPTTNCTVQGITGSGTTWTVTMRAGNAGVMSVRYVTASVSSNALSLSYDPPAAFAAKVNFQPPAAPVPSGYVPDIGNLFGARSGLNYGWSVDHISQGRDRNQVSDQRQDTLMLMKLNAIWEIEVPNGSYDVTLSVGDAGGSSLVSLSVEGSSVWSRQRFAAGAFSVKTVRIAVSDGRLTMANSAASNNQTRLNYIDIRTAGAPIAAGKTHGLTADYFAGVSFDTLRFTRVDACVDNRWQSLSPDARLSADRFSVRWRGCVVPRYSQPYTFITTSDDGVRLWVNDQMIINNWNDHGETQNTGSIQLSAGVPATIKMEFYENGGDAVARLEWQSGSQTREIIPNERLLINETEKNTAPYPLTFAEWQSSGRVTGSTTTSDSDGDGASDLFEYALGTAASTGVQTSEALTITLAANGDTEVSSSRPRGLTDVEWVLESSNDLKDWTTESIMPVITDLGDGTERCVWLNPVRRIVRLRVVHSSGAVALSSPASMQKLALNPGTQTVGVSVVRAPVFSGTISSINGSTLLLNDDASLTAAVDADARYYLEIRAGKYAGQRFDVKSVADSSLEVDLTAPYNTLAAIPSDLVGASIVVRPHLMLSSAFDPDRLQAGLTPTAADQVLFFENGGYVTYWLFNGGGDESLRGWLRVGDGADTSRANPILAPGTGVMVKVLSGARTWSMAGQVRTNVFVQRLMAGHNLIASPWPTDQSPQSLGLTQPGLAAGSRNPQTSDQLQRWNGDISGGVPSYSTFWLLDNQLSMRYWLALASGSLASVDTSILMPAHRSLFYKAQAGTAARTWTLPLP
ncbi:MAG: putative Ig domain-containing protein [Verrucomicrobiaceae bacterium]|nr:putative Ig domain-containing protein [Verrucomicrobiaceae bacterium]